VGCELNCGPLVPVKIGRVAGVVAADAPPELELPDPLPEPEPELEPEPEPGPDPAPEPPDEEEPPPEDEDEEPEPVLDAPPGPEAALPEVELEGAACGGKDALILKLRLTSWLSEP
jgi:hypothetical protein